MRAWPIISARTRTSQDSAQLFSCRVTAHPAAAGAAAATAIVATRSYLPIICWWRQTNSVQCVVADESVALIQVLKYIGSVLLSLEDMEQEQHEEETEQELNPDGGAPAESKLETYGYVYN